MKIKESTKKRLILIVMMIASIGLLLTSFLPLLYAF
jgi:hypothetical protein